MSAAHERDTEGIVALVVVFLTVLFFIGWFIDGAKQMPPTTPPPTSTST